MKNYSTGTNKTMDSSGKKPGLRKKVGDAIEKLGDKIEHSGMKKVGDAIEKFGDKIEHSGDRVKKY